jgi:hypothetical protein
VNTTALSVIFKHFGMKNRKNLHQFFFIILDLEENLFGNKVKNLENIFPEKQVQQKQ